MSEQRSELRALQQRLAAAGVGSRALQGSHAFTHEAPAAEALCAHLRGFEDHKPAIRFISNLTVAWVASAQASNFDYRAQDPLQPVRLSSSLSSLLVASVRWLVEELCTFAQRRPYRQALLVAMASLPAVGRHAGTASRHRRAGRRRDRAGTGLRHEPVQEMANTAQGVWLELGSRGEPAAADVERLQRVDAQVLCMWPRPTGTPCQRRWWQMARFGVLQGVVRKRSFILVLADGGMMCPLPDGSGGQLAAGPRFQGSSAS